MPLFMTLGYPNGFLQIDKCKVSFGVKVLLHCIITQPTNSKDVTKNKRLEAIGAGASIQPHEPNFLHQLSYFCSPSVSNNFSKLGNAYFEHNQ